MKCRAYALHSAVLLRPLTTMVCSSATATALLVIFVSLVGAALAVNAQTAPSRYFIRQPKSGSYYLLNKPRTVKCVVERDVEANIVCNDIPVPPEQLKKKTVVKGIEVSIDIDKSFVKGYGSIISCQCIATKLGSKDPRVYNSNSVQFIKAFLLRRFGLQPQSQTLPIGSTIILRCKPPKGDPPPSVFWTYRYNKSAALKRVQLNERTKLFEATDLQINNATISDSGIYKCVATNQASYRYSSEAVIKIFDDTLGKWSEWSDWVPCKRGTSIRVRNCLSSMRKPCKGERFETRTCSTPAAPTQNPVKNVGINPDVRVERQSQSVLSTTPSGCGSKEDSSYLVMASISYLLYSNALFVNI